MSRRTRPSFWRGRASLIVSLLWTISITTPIMFRRPSIISPAQLKALKPKSFIPVDASWKSKSVCVRRPRCLSKTRCRQPRRLLVTLLPSSMLTPLPTPTVVPGSAVSGKEDFLRERIPSARFFDLDEVALDHPLGLKHMLPSAEQFGTAAGQS